MQTWSEALEVARLYAGVASLAIAALAFIVSLLSLRNSRRATGIAARAQEYDYAIRLQIRAVDPPIASFRSSKDMYIYSFKLVNAGLKSLFV